MLTVTIVFKDGEDLIQEAVRPPWRYADFLCVRANNDDVGYYPVADIASFTVSGAAGEPREYRGKVA